jgi:hypothetical protein
MSYTKNTALANFNVFMNSLGKVPAWTKSKNVVPDDNKCKCQQKQP